MGFHGSSIVATAAVATTALAASNVDPVDKFAWGENVGWTNWRDANSTDQGAYFGGAFALGFVWGENVGWINLGDGTPANGMQYANTTGADSGVNIDTATNALFGFAWGENIGWINFDTRPTLMGSNQHARIDRATGRLRGYAWGENVGWINLDDATHFVGVSCPADLSGDGVVTAADLALLLGSWGPGPSVADLNGDGSVGAPDLALLLGSWGACP